MCVDRSSSSLRVRISFEPRDPGILSPGKNFAEQEGRRDRAPTLAVVPQFFNQAPRERMVANPRRVRLEAASTYYFSMALAGIPCRARSGTAVQENQYV